MNILDQKIGKLWEKVMELDGTKIEYIHGGKTYAVTVSIEDAARFAEYYFAILKTEKEVVSFTVRKADLPFTPGKGDHFLFQGKKHVVFQTSGKDFFEYADTSFQALRIAGYRNE